jgi:hypothetical protein
MHIAIASRLARLAAAAVLATGWVTAHAQAAGDPPGRVATMSEMQGSVVFAPDGEDEWRDLPVNRPLTRGDRVWTDRGARAELHMGAATVHMDGESNLAFFELDDNAAQLSLTQGSVNARVRELAAGEDFELATPNLAIRASQPGDFRVDVDKDSGTTRVVVRSGQVVVFGERGESVRLAAGQQGAFDGRGLAQVRARARNSDDFDQWASERNVREDQSIAARYVPRSVVGYQQLDAHGTWAQDAQYGTVWYPRSVAADWAPYRDGRWVHIKPWGWTWVDAAPWGFAPAHYGRWTQIGPRWAWVPGHFTARPVYAPALVAFVGGSGGNVQLSIGNTPGIGWYPLAPGEAWAPTFRASTAYVAGVNRQHRHQPQTFRARTDVITAVRIEDFNRGRSVRENWRASQPVQQYVAPRAAQPAMAPAMPQPRVDAEDRTWGQQRWRVQPPAAQQLQPVPRGAWPQQNQRQLRVQDEDDDDRGRRRRWNGWQGRQG